MSASGGFTVREARVAELPAAGEVVVAAYRTLGWDDEHGYLEHVRDAVGRARHCPILVAADPGGALLGCVTYVPGPGNPFAELEQDGEAGFRMLGVVAEARGRGVGEALVRACIARARAEGRRGLAITTSPLMLAAHRLYERLGFVRAPGRDFEPVPGIRLWAYVLAL
jgi:ribosomal protein S18 acetylase RimI-like enzyme